MPPGIERLQVANGVILELGSLKASGGNGVGERPVICRGHRVRIRTFVLRQCVLYQNPDSEQDLPTLAFLVLQEHCERK